MFGAAEGDWERLELDGAGQAVERPVRRRQDGRAPAQRLQRARQVADDVADTADLAAG
jgi:hypothetical protein